MGLMFGSQTFGLKQIFGPQKILVLAKNLSKTNVGPKKMWVQKLLGRKNLGPKNLPSWDKGAKTIDI